MSDQAPGPGGNMDLPQGHLGLLESDLARRLLVSTVPARFAFIWADGIPGVLPTWFHWTGTELVMPTFLSAPHVRKAAATYLAQVDQPGTRMARIAVRPTWVGVIDFHTRLPVGMGGVAGREGQAGDHRP